MKKIFAAILIIFCLVSCDQTPTKWVTKIDNGVFDRVEYNQGGVFNATITTYYFQDGRTYICGGLRDNIMIKGHRYSIEEAQGCRGYRITELSR